MTYITDENIEQAKFHVWAAEHFGHGNRKCLRLDEAEAMGFDRDAVIDFALDKPAFEYHTDHPPRIEMWSP